MTNAIELSHIQKTFPQFALRDVSLAVPTGTICGLVGENGAGKSTLIRILMGALRPESGRATVLGADTAAPDFPAVREDIGVVLDEGCFPETLTAPQVGRIMAATYRRWEQDTFDAYCKRFGLPEKTAIKDYSRGMKMKLTIAAALSHQARLLVLDEATAGLDPIVRDEILDIFYEFTRDETHSVLISSHILSDLEKICDYIAFLHEGQLWYITTHRPDLSSGLYDVDVFESRDSLHEAKGGENRILERNYRITGNIEGKQIIIVDDVLTSGQSMADYKEEIERCGGKVVAAIFYGKTVTRPPLLLIKAHVWGGCIVNKIKELTK